MSFGFCTFVAEAVVVSQSAQRVAVHTESSHPEGCAPSLEIGALPAETTASLGKGDVADPSSHEDASVSEPTAKQMFAKFIDDELVAEVHSLCEMYVLLDTTTLREGGCRVSVACFKGHCCIVKDSPSWDLALREKHVLESPAYRSAAATSGGLLVQTAKGIPDVDVDGRVRVMMEPLSHTVLPVPIVDSHGASKGCSMYPPLSGDLHMLCCWMHSRFTTHAGSHPLTEDDFIARHDIVRDVSRLALRALRHLHQAGFAHRDVKLENFVYAFEPRDDDSNASCATPTTPVTNADSDDSAGALVAEHGWHTTTTPTLREWLSQRRFKLQLIDVATVTMSETEIYGRSGWTGSYASPELFTAFLWKRPVTLAHMMAADVFALGMTLSSLLLLKIYSAPRCNDPLQIGRMNTQETLRRAKLLASGMVPAMPSEEASLSWSWIANMLNLQPDERLSLSNALNFTN